MDVEDSVLSDVGTDTSTVRSGPGSFFHEVAVHAGRVASVERLGTVGELPTLSFASLVPLVYPIQKLGRSKINTARIRKRGEQAIGLLSVSRYRFTAAGAIWGSCVLVPIVKCCTVATAAGPRTEEPRAYWI